MEKQGIIMDDSNDIKTIEQARKQVGDIVYQNRIYYGITKYKMTEKCGLAYTQINNIENGEGFTFNSLIKLMLFFGGSLTINDETIHINGSD